MKTLLTGKAYVNAAETDLRKTFARIRRELKDAAERAARDADEAAAKTVPIAMAITARKKV